MQFRHPNGVRLSLLSGHVARVGSEWMPLHPRFHQAAMLAGCEVDHGIISPANETAPAASEAAMVNTDSSSVIRRTLQKMIERDEPGDFTGTNLPSIKAVEKLAGIQVDKGEVYRIFRDMKAQAGADTAESESE